MKIDLYTKAVLTVIAAALVALVGQNFTKPAQAQFDRKPKVTTGGALVVTVCGGFMNADCAYVSPEGRISVEPN